MISKKITYFSFPGAKESLVESKDSLAKKIEFEGMPNQFYAKYSTSGMDSGQLCNPNSPLYNPINQTKFHSETGKYHYEWKKVKEEIFELYLSFLKTGNVAYIRQAERVQ